MKKKSIAILTSILMLLAASVPVGVQAADAPATEITLQEQPVVKVKAGGVVVEVQGSATQHVVIYALTGQVIKQLDVPSGATFIELPAGYYIVRVAHTTVKVAVK